MADVAIQRDRKSTRKGLPKYWRDDTGPLRLMAVVEGYAMMRRPGALPFIVSGKDLHGWRRGIRPDTAPENSK